jgi:hypothetical protein
VGSLAEVDGSLHAARVVMHFDSTMLQRGGGRGSWDEPAALVIAHMDARLLDCDQWHSSRQRLSIASSGGSEAGPGQRSVRSDPSRRSPAVLAKQSLEAQQDFLKAVRTSLCAAFCAVACWRT